MKQLVTVVALATFLVVLGCQQAMAPIAEPPPALEAPEPTLVGTWQFIRPERDDSGMSVNTVTLTLTFTKSRFVEFHVRRGSDGNITEYWRETGTWIATDDIVTKTYFEWDEQNRQRYADATMVDKNYAWGDEARDVLFIHSWESNGEEDRYQRGTRIKDPITYPLTGVWKGDYLWDKTDRQRWTYTFGDSFIHHYDDEYGYYPDHGSLATLTKQTCLSTSRWIALRKQ